MLDNVGEVLWLAQFNVQAGFVINAVDGSGVGATFVDGYLALSR